jgi:predicted DNA-binding transcriptional regulator YafY
MSIPGERTVFFADAHVITFDYTNHKGQSARRRIRPLRVWYGTSDYHLGEHWYLRAHDLDKQADRDFQLAGMRDIEEEKGCPDATK